MFRQIFGRLRTLSHRTYKNKFAVDVLNNEIVYFTFYNDRGPEGDKTRRNTFPNNNLEKITQIKI
jgi:hypothetical protein